MIIETKNPNTPRITIPTAETLATVWNSSFVGFFKECQTLLDLTKKDFDFVNKFGFSSSIEKVKINSI